MLFDHGRGRKAFTFEATLSSMSLRNAFANSGNKTTSALAEQNCACTKPAVIAFVNVLITGLFQFFPAFSILILLALKIVAQNLDKTEIHRKWTALEEALNFGSIINNNLRMDTKVSSSSRFVNISIYGLVNVSVAMSVVKHFLNEYFQGI